MGLFPSLALLSNISETLAISLPLLIRSLSFLDRSVYACPNATEIARRTDDLPAPFGPTMRFRPWLSGILAYS